MKKYLNVIVSLVLVVVCMIFGIVSNDSVTVGAGNGENYKVSTMEEMYSVLSFITDKKAEDEVTTQATEEPSIFYTVDNALLEIKDEHTSLTMQEDAVVKTYYTHKKAEQNYDGNIYYTTIGRSQASMSRSMTLYMTEQASYYISKGQISNSYNATDSRDSSSSSIMFDMEIYVAKTKALLKFNEFAIVSEEYNQQKGETEKTCMTVKASAKGKWVEAPQEAVGDMLNMVNSANKDAMSMLKEYIEKSFVDEDYTFDKESETYTLKETLEGAEVNLVCDFSEKKTPYLELVTKYKDDENKIYVYGGMTFSNIDNTVINGNIKAEYVCKDMDEFDSLVEER